MFDFLNSLFSGWFGSKNISNVNYHGKVVTIHTLNSEGKKVSEGKIPFSHLSEIANNNKYSIDTTVIVLLILIIICVIIYKHFKAYKYIPVRKSGEVKIGENISLSNISTDNNIIPYEQPKFHKSIYPKLNKNSSN